MTLAKGLVGSVLLGIALLGIGYEALDAMTWELLVASGLLGIALGDTFFFAALRHLNAYAVVVFFMLGQALTAGLAFLLLGEDISPPEILGIGLTLGGVSLVLVSQCSNEKSGSSSVLGIVFGLLSMLCMSVSVIIAKPALAITPSIQATFIRMLAGMLGILVFSLFTGRISGFLKPFGSLKLSLRFLLSVGVVTFGGFWLSLVGIKYLDVAVANTLGSTEPLFALPLAVVFLKERVTLLVVLGSLLCIGGVVILTGGWLPS